MITLALFAHKAPEAAGYGTYIVHLNCDTCSKLLYIGVSLSLETFFIAYLRTQAYALSSPISAFISFAIFASQSEASIDNEYAKETLNWWMGFTLLIAVGTLTYITLMHILPEVFLSDHDNEDHDHFGNDDEEEKEGLLDSTEQNNPTENKQM